MIRRKARSLPSSGRLFLAVEGTHRLLFGARRQSLILLLLLEKFLEVLVLSLQFDISSLDSYFLVHELLDFTLQGLIVIDPFHAAPDSALSVLETLPRLLVAHWVCQVVECPILICYGLI